MEHEAIEGLMPAMTMTFKVAQGIDLRAITPGSQVDFDLANKATGFEVLTMAPTCLLYTSDAADE